MEYHSIGYTMKASYQQNMLLGLVGAVSFSVVATIVLLSLGPAQQPGHNAGYPHHSMSAANDTVLDGRSRETSPRDVPGSTTWGLNPYAGTHHGFSGFLGYSIVADEPEPVVCVQPPRQETLAHEPSLDVRTEQPSGPGEISSADDTDDDFFPPDTAVKLAVNRDVELVFKVDPETPWLAEELGREGSVEVLIYLDQTGRQSPYSARSCVPNDSSAQLYLDCVLKDGSKARLEFYIDSVSNDLFYVVLKESPPDYGFAKNLTDVLPRWSFSPRVKNGRPVGTFVKITFEFCLRSKHTDQDDCSKLTISTS